MVMEVRTLCTPSSNTLWCICLITLSTSSKSPSRMVPHRGKLIFYMSVTLHHFDGTGYVLAE